MNGDIFFRTMPIGGFNKEDVLEYIGGQQQQIADLQKKLAEKDRFLEDARRRENALKAQLNDYQKKADEYFKLSENYRAECEKQKAKIESLNKTVSNIEVSFERTKDVEGQIGALVIDALLYSDKIIQSAKNSAVEISTDTKKTLAQAVNGVGEIGSDITEISDNFAEVVASLSSKLNALSKNLTNVADTLDEVGADAGTDRYVVGENSDVSLPNLKESDFEAGAQDEDITAEEINELLQKLQIHLDEIEAPAEPQSDIINSSEPQQNEDMQNLFEDEISLEQPQEQPQTQSAQGIEVVPIEIPAETETELETENLNNPEENAENENMQAPSSSPMIIEGLNIDDLLKDVDKTQQPSQNANPTPNDYELSAPSSSNILNEDISDLMKKFLDSND